MDARSIADRSANSQETLQIATNPLAKLAISRRRTNTAGQAEIAVGVVVGEPLVSKAHQREQRGVEVHRVHPALDGVTAELISGAVGVACFYQAAGEPHRVAVDVVIAAVAGMADLHKADARCASRCVMRPGRARLPAGALLVLLGVVSCRIHVATRF